MSPNQWNVDCAASACAVHVRRYTSKHKQWFKRQLRIKQRLNLVKRKDCVWKKMLHEQRKIPDTHTLKTLGTGGIISTLEAVCQRQSLFSCWRAFVLKHQCDCGWMRETCNLKSNWFYLILNRYLGVLACQPKENMLTEELIRDKHWWTFF